MYPPVNSSPFCLIWAHKLREHVVFFYLQHVESEFLTSIASFAAEKPATYCHVYSYMYYPDGQAAFERSAADLSCPGAEQD